MSQATLSERPYANSNLFSGHYLDERIHDREEWDCDEEAGEAMTELQALYELESGLVDGYKEDSLIDNWIDEVLDVLGFGTNVETTLPGGGGYVDVLLFEDTESRRGAAEVYLSSEDTTDLFDRGIGLVEAKQWDADFSKRFSEQRPYRNASHQIKHYLERTPESIQWGVLTNGRKWRLYGTKDYETQTYYEIDLPELLERGDLEAFKYFYLFFRPDAFRTAGGTTFLDSVWSESETVAQELGEDLQDNVFTAVRVLGRGFVETNDLDIDPDDEAGLGELKEQSLVLLYRLMFVLYAESRGLIHPEGQDAVTEYEENFSLDELRLEIHEEIGEVDDGFDTYSEHSTTMWSRLEDLFRLVDEGEESLGIPPYNGGLFNQDKHEFLTEHEVSNRYIAEVIYRISTTENDEGRYVLADYADLDTRHLGSVYEGLLEHQFRIAPEDYAAVSEDGGEVWKPATEVSVADAVETVDEGGLYVVNDEGERKATGAYYTPDYVVTYIVEETVGPLVDEIKADLEEQGFEPGTHEHLGAFYRRATDLKILDPAMGSGHFLTRATEYLAEQVMTEVREIEEATAFDEQRVRRDVAKECIYGVDLNGMAVELAKLSMWLETLAADQPLAFLDHHLKAGNSLVGSDVTEVLSNGADTDDDGGQLTLQQALARVRQDTLEHVMDRMQELLEIDNETLEDVKSMEELYDEVRSDPFYQRLFELTNVHTAERFDLDVPEGAYERMARAIDDEDEWAAVREEGWFQTAQSMAGGEAFFHWELEYPEVFFDDDGEKRDDAGFDAVIGNPPYVKIQNIRQSNSALADYASEQYTTSTGRFDLYGLFVEQGSNIAADDELGYILPNKFFESQSGEGLRKFLSKEDRVRKIVDFGQHQVFEGATTYTCLLFLGESANLNYGEVRNFKNDKLSLSQVKFSTIPFDELDNSGWVLTGPLERQAMSQMESTANPLGEITEFMSEGIVSGDNDVLFVEVDDWGEEEHLVRCTVNEEQYRMESEVVKPLLDGDEIERYGSTVTDLAVIYPYQTTQAGTKEILESQLESEYPETYSYLSEFRTRLSERGTESMNYPTWYSLWCPREKRLFESPKLLVPDICQRSEFTLDMDGEIFLPNSAYGVVPEENSAEHRSYLLAVLNSSPVWFYIYHTSPVLRGDFRRFMTSYLSRVPVPEYSPVEETKPDFESKFEAILQRNGVEIPENRHGFLGFLAENNRSFHIDLDSLNLSLVDHLGTYSSGQCISEIGLSQPPEGTADSILTDTAADRDNLRVGTVEIVRESPTSLEIRLTARYKPENEDDYETDRWGYTETEPLPALELSDLTETEADLIEAFVPVAVDEAGGFANFRETATKTNSLVDRLRKLTLPAVDDVRDGLESYLETKERADELEAKIEKTDELIDEIVYELYGLTDEEIEIVEEAVGE
ncbi:Eco57I restriction-modification methylase domain-containing protein [Natronorubrum sp. DTA7]|uniref:Eco57I restriction-modification methylase domain-containing protein n=1 Tax=Natronorubrum sp. DTA7 TaxID=3447016 RepID=UPI003F8635B7